MAEELTDDLKRRLLAQVPFQGRSNVAFLCHEAAEALSKLEAENALLRARLGPGPPMRCTYRSSDDGHAISRPAEPQG